MKLFTILFARNDGSINGNDPYPDDAWNGQPHYYWNGSIYAGYWSDQDGDGTPDDFDSTPVPGYTYNGIFYAGDWSDRDSDGVPDPADPTPDGTYWNPLKRWSRFTFHARPSCAEATSRHRASGGGDVAGVNACAIISSIP